MNEYSLDKYGSEVYLDDFLASKLEIVPYQEEGYYRFHKGNKTKIENKGLGYSAVQLEQMRRRGIVEIHLNEVLEHAFCEIGPDDRRFGVKLQTMEGKVSTEILKLAEDLIGQITDFDQQARKVSNESDFEHEEELAFISVSDHQLELHYYATTVNTEWRAYFVKSNDGTWQFKGLG